MEQEAVIILSFINWFSERQEKFLENADNPYLKR